MAEWSNRPIAIGPVALNGPAGDGDGATVRVGAALRLGLVEGVGVGVGPAVGDPVAELPQPPTAKARRTPATAMRRGRETRGFGALVVMT